MTMRGTNLIGSAGLHHITAICSDPAENLRFYTRELGLRLVKKTVNFDDPGAYHLYYGDRTGQPGSCLTFFPFAGAPRGRHGTGSAVEIGLAVPLSSIAYWAERLSARNIGHRKAASRFGESVIALEDPDGLALELVGTAWAETAPGWSDPSMGPDTVPREHSVRGFSGVALWLREAEATAQVLTDGLGLAFEGEDGGRLRYRCGDGMGLGATVDLKRSADAPTHRPGAGTIHHVALRAADDAAEMALRDQLVASGLEPTAQIDRTYFQSVYAREPGGVLLEIATDAPGFTLDEPERALGADLMLPERYEHLRDAIEDALPPLG